MTTRTAAFILLVASMAAPALAAQGAPRRAPPQSIAGKWQGCASHEGRSACAIYEFKVNGDTLTGTVTPPDGDDPHPLVQGRIQGDRISFRTGNGCTPQTTAACAIVQTATFRGEDEWRLYVDVTDNGQELVLTMRRVPGSP
jgi:hypothetical protein